jgi:hypothetical protein
MTEKFEIEMSEKVAVILQVLSGVFSLVKEIFVKCGREAMPGTGY